MVPVSGKLALHEPPDVSDVSRAPPALGTPGGLQRLGGVALAPLRLALRVGREADRPARPRAVALLVVVHPHQRGLLRGGRLRQVRSQPGVKLSAVDVVVHVRGDVHQLPARAVGVLAVSADPRRRRRPPPGLPLREPVAGVGGIQGALLHQVADNAGAVDLGNRLSLEIPDHLTHRLHALARGGDGRGWCAVAAFRLRERGQHRHHHHRQRRQQHDRPQHEQEHAPHLGSRLRP